MGGFTQTGLGTGVAPLLDALGRFCDAEGLAVSDLHSIHLSTTRSKSSSFKPMAPAATTSMSLVAPPIPRPGDEETKH